MNADVVCASGVSLLMDYLEDALPADVRRDDKDRQHGSRHHLQPAGVHLPGHITDDDIETAHSGRQDAGCGVSEARS